MTEIITGDYAPLQEKAIRSDGTIGIKIIAPGWGSSGYYSPEVLQRDIPKAFPPGTHMFWNHDTITEETERPEGDLSRLAGVTLSLPRWEEAGANGPGMYTDAMVSPAYAESLDSIADYIGVSIRGMGRQTGGEADGREGPLVDEITAGRSIDFVTAPGAGGKVLQVFESAPGVAKLPEPEAIEESVDNSEQENVMEKELKEAQDMLTEATATIADLTVENAKLNERLLLQEAHRFVTSALIEVDLPVITRERLAKTLQTNPPIVEGQIDEAAYTVAINAAVTEAQTEIAAISGQNGQITGQGKAQPVATGATFEEAQKRTSAALAELGYGGDK